VNSPIVDSPVLPLLAATKLANCHQAADHEHQHGERRQERGPRDVRGQPGPGGSAADRGHAEGDAAGQQHVAGSVCRHGADQ